MFILTTKIYKDFETIVESTTEFINRDSANICARYTVVLLGQIMTKYPVKFRIIITHEDITVDVYNERSVKI